MHPTAAATVLAHLRMLSRNDLATLQGVIGASKAVLCKDADGDWWLTGRPGCYVTATNGTYTIVIEAGTQGRWRSTKRQLADFTMVTLDACDAGALKLTRLPNEIENAALRAALGLRQTRPASSADHLHRPPAPAPGSCSAPPSPPPPSPPPSASSTPHRRQQRGKAA
jgi:hypothetical protein